MTWPDWLRRRQAGPDAAALTAAFERLSEELAESGVRLAQARAETARERERMQAILNATSDGLLLYDTSRCIIAANERCALLLGFTHDQLLRDDLAALEVDVQARSRQSHGYHEALEQHFADPAATHQDLLELERPQRRILRRSSSPLIDNGRVAGRVFTYTDVTIEAELDRVKSEFVAMASHELRTPLTSVHGALQLALAGSGAALAPEDRDLLEISVGSTERLVRLLNDLLDLSKIEAGAMPMRALPIDVRGLVADAVGAMHGLAASRTSRVVVERAPGDTVVVGDRDQLIRVLGNLLSNALKYSPPGSAVGVRIDERAERVRVTVTDQGPGIPPQQIERLFRPFARLGVHEHDTTGGTGLGLAISHALVEQHGGRIWAEPNQPTGARFIVDLPVLSSAPRESAGAVTRENHHECTADRV
jgi:signal transduction histidine kinase